MQKIKSLLLLLIYIFVNNALSDDLNTGKRTLIFYDHKRDRKLITDVWYPTLDTPVTVSGKEIFKKYPEAENANIFFNGTKLPLIMLSHGTGGNRQSLQWLAAALVSKGYIVAAVDHFGNTFDNVIPEEFIKFWERPQDISFVLNYLLDSSLFKKYIDENRIGAAGFSLGGYTVLALGGAEVDFDVLLEFSNTPEGIKEATIPELPGLIELLISDKIRKKFKTAPSLYDKRIKAVFAFAPAMGGGFKNKMQFSNLTIPVYLIGTESDSIAPVKFNAKHYSELIDGSIYHLFEGRAGHYVFLGEATELGKEIAPVFCKDDDSVDRVSIIKQTQQLAVEFFDKYVK